MCSLKQTIGTHENNFNLVRLILAASVIFYHSFLLCGTAGYDDPLDKFLTSHGASLGDVAVGSFFFLSGIFVTQSYHRDPNPLNFVLRRFCRLWPGYFVCLCVTATFACLASKAPGSTSFFFSQDFWNYILSNARFSMVWEIPGAFQDRINTGINGSIHTIPTEVKACELLFALGCVLSFKNMRYIVYSVSVALAITVFYYHFLGRVLQVNGNAHLPLLMFLFGAVAFAFAEYVKPFWWFAVATVALMLFAPVPVNTIALLSFSAWSMIYIGQSPYCRSPRVDLSYGIYIYGWPSQQLIASYAHFSPYTHALIAFLLATVFAFLSWFLIEKPAINLARKTIVALRQRALEVP